MSSEDLTITHARGPLHVQHHGWHTSEVGHPIHSWFNPTYARLRHEQHDIDINWNSRAHRKGRYPRLAGKHAQHKTKFPRLWGWEFNNISWWVAQFFTWGSVAWVLNGFFAWLWLSDENLVLYGVGYTALVGGTLFECGAILAVFEALNPGQGLAFGYAVHKLVTGETHFKPLPRQDRPPRHGHPVKVHHASDKAADGASQPDGSGGNKLRGLWRTFCGGSGLSRTSAQATGSNPADVEMGQHHNGGNGAGGKANGQNGHNGHQAQDGALAAESKQPPQVQPQKWSWWPPGNHKWHDIAFLATLIQLVGATLFQWSVIMGVPGVLPTETENYYIAWDITYWGTQVVGAWGFIISAGVFMLECQKKWYLPNPLSLGWQVGFWNFIGAWGFEFSGLFGIWAEPYGRYQKWGTQFSTFWGGWAFLIGSYIQLVETLNKH